MPAPLILLVRHGIAEDGSATVSDSERRLTADGARRVRQIARGLRRLGIRPDVLLSSPLRRAMETAAAAGKELAPSVAVTLEPRLAPGGDPADLVAALRERRGASQLLLFGHQPDLGALASYLLTGSPQLVPLPFKKGGVAAIAVAALPPSRPGTLLWFATPKQLRAIACARSA